MKNHTDSVTVTQAHTLLIKLHKSTLLPSVTAQESSPTFWYYIHQITVPERLKTLQSRVPAFVPPTNS